VIKLKKLLKESAEEATKRSMKIYWHFLLNALSGRNPDDFYRQYRREIDAIAKLLVERYGPTSGGTVYRGIILDPSEVHSGKVQHAPEITYVSFSEDKQIALAFGDTENPIASSLMQRYSNKRGYLITAEYRPDQILFHHKWLTDGNMWPAIKNQFGDDAKYTEMQKEIILKPKPYYRVEPIPPGISGGMEVGRE
jgi:hypothetical protein